MGTVIDNDSLEIPETKPEKILKKLALYLTSFFFIFTGFRHIFIPELYQIMMPSYLPIPLFFIYLTGALQIICAVMIVSVKTRRWGAYGLMFFLLATLPVLVYIWTYEDPNPTLWVPSWLRMLSIPLQFALIFWVYLFAKKPKSF